MDEKRPDALTLLAFGAVCLVGGTNFVAVKLSNRELPPFYGAGLRFLGAALILLAIVAVARIPLPRGRALTGTLLFGVLSFFIAYAFVYWGLQRTPAALGGLIFGTVPLSTFVLAIAQGLERFRVRAVVGAAIAIAGVGVMAGTPSNGSTPIVPLLAVVASTIAAAEGAVVVKRFPPVHPVAMNAIAMGTGAALLLPLSLVSGERWIVPQEPTTWWTLLFVIPVGSVGLFILYIFVIHRWTASGASYQFVLFPPVSAVAAAILIDEPLTIAIAVGAVLVVAGTYVGALATAARDQSA
jgi:drug/metabolite transporter (DMT)-like permease